MNTGTLVVIFLRLAVPPVILRHPLGGLIACMVLDTFDVALVEILGGDSFGGATISYHSLDKFLDTYYLGFAAVVSQRWTDPLLRRTSFVLFFHRAIGVALFEATGWRTLLLLFPNIFEYFFLFVVLTAGPLRRFRIQTVPHLAIVLLVVGIPQLAREYVFHRLGMTLVEQINAFTPWNIEEPTVWEWLQVMFHRVVGSS